MKFDSLAMIETSGFVSALVAADKMLSFKNVEYFKKEVTSNGQVTLFIKGNLPEINEILDAGIIAAQNIGIVIASGIIPYPNSKIEKIIFESTTTESKSKKVKKNIKKVEEKIDTLFDLLDEETSLNNFMAEVGGNNPDVAGEDLLIKHHKQNENILEVETSDIEDDVDEIVEIKLENLEDSGASEKISEEDVEEISDEKTDFEGWSHIERLRAEAKSEIESKMEDEKSITKFKPLTDETLTTNEVSEVNGNDEENLENDLYKMNVPELRKLARSNKDFPIKGREISKANRQVLLEYFAKL
ncbi:MAG: BMC domain-containing protein [Melioribacteraceae bacterium]|nr:BMC domain-containing protein [Melioribacteraceae bacterium]